MVLNGIEGNRTKYPKRKVNYKENDNGILYGQYGFDKNGYNKYGRKVYGFEEWGLNKNYYNMHGFDKEGLNKDVLNKFGYKKI